MELLFLIIGAIVLIGILRTVFSSKKTKLFRRVWSSSKLNNFEANAQAIEGLWKEFKLTELRGINSENEEKFKEHIVEILTNAIDFDIRHARAAGGVSVAREVAQKIRSQVSGKGLEPLEKMLSEVCSGIGALSQFDAQRLIPVIAGYISGKDSELPFTEEQIQETRDYINSGIPQRMIACIQSAAIADGVSSEESSKSFFDSVEVAEAKHIESGHPEEKAKELAMEEIIGEYEARLA